VFATAAFVVGTSVREAWAQRPAEPPWFDSYLNQPTSPPPAHSVPPSANAPPAARPANQLFPPPPPPAVGRMLEEPRRLPPTDLPLEPPPPANVFTPGQIIAWVGDEPIQVGDVMPMVERQSLKGAIELKLLYLDFVRGIPADKRTEFLPKIKAKAEEQFYQKQVPQALEKAKVGSIPELDAQLRQFGSSLAQQKAAFVERALGQSVLQQKINYEPEVTHQEMLTYYHEHQREFERQAQARWEKLTVRSDRLPNKAEAWAALGNIGNEVLRGAPLNAVAKRSSQGVDAADGGYHDWTTQGALASDVLDQAIFSLPVGQLSERLEDKEGFHIVRVIERRDAGRIPFVDAQVEIKEKLKKEKIRKQTEDYVVRLRKEIRVWTIFGDDPAAEVKTATRPDERASPRR
jgi:hypothetical protein